MTQCTIKLTAEIALVCSSSLFFYMQHMKIEGRKHYMKQDANIIISHQTKMR